MEQASVPLDTWRILLWHHCMMYVRVHVLLVSDCCSCVLPGVTCLHLQVRILCDFVLVIIPSPRVRVSMRVSLCICRGVFGEGVRLFEHLFIR